MAKPINEVIDEILDAMRREQLSFITMSWPVFYALNDISRFKADRKEQLTDRGILKGIILGYGDNAVVASRDTNFVPVKL